MDNTWLPRLQTSGDAASRRRLLRSIPGAVLGAGVAAGEAKRRKRKRKKKKKDSCGRGLSKLAGRCVEQCETSATCDQAFCRTSYDGVEGVKVCAFFNFTGDCDLITHCNAHDDCAENELCVVFTSCTVPACGQVSFG